MRVRLARHRPATPVVAALVAVALLGATAGPVAATTGQHRLRWDKRLDGLDQPTQVTSARDGSPRLFVTEKTGRIRVVRGDRLLARPFLDLSGRVRTTGEGGLLSVAFHPDYVTHPFFWVAFTDRAGDLRVARFRARSAGADRALPGSYRRVLDVAHPARYNNHYGGQLAFGVGGYLFVSTGDGGGSGDPGNRAQDLRVLAGKILRLQVRHARQACGRFSCVPPSNPYAGAVPGRGAIWASGLRNPWRFSVDPLTGDLWVGDVGEARFEEVDRIPRDAGGANLGWSCLEGNATYDASRCSRTAYLEPQWLYGRDVGGSVVGGFVYRGARLAGEIGGRYVGGDFVSGRVFVAGPTGVAAAGRLARVTSFGEDDARELWAVTLDGGLYRLSAA